jgi:two-component SAPR family response regulator
MKILIVDDEAYLREELKDSLERVAPSNEYCEAENYDSAIKLLGENCFDIAFLDIQLKGKSGLAIAESAKRISPKTNIVMVTAYSEYALDAFKLFVSGYILKPFTDNDLREVLDNLRTPVQADNKKLLEVQCFGSFEVYADGKPMKFRRSKEKELLAYLISLKGASANRNEICLNIFEESVSPDKAATNFRQIFASLKKDLARQGFEDVIIHDSKNAYSVDVALIHCDYYDYITGKTTAGNTYQGEFMNQYSWAEQYIYAIEN